MDKYKHQKTHNFHVNVGEPWRQRLKQLSRDMGNAGFATLARWGLTILEQSVANTPYLAYAKRLNGRTVAAVHAELWQLWVNGDIVLPGDGTE